MTCKYLIVIAVFAGILTACNGGENNADRTTRRSAKEKSGPSITVQIENEKALVYGDTIFVTVATADGAEKITRITAHRINHNKKIGDEERDFLAIPTLISGGGDVRLKIEAHFASGKKSTRYKTLKVKSPEPAQNWDLEVLSRYPHSKDAYTQGFLVYEGYVYEGTGTYGGSRIMKAELNTGKILQEKALSSEYFGEGITIFNDKLYQLTYKAGKAFVYDLQTFDQIDELTYHFQTTEGWGLTHNDTSLIASDGSANLYFLNPNDFSIQKTIEVFDEDGSVINVNELEYHGGIIYANLYTSARIIAIDAISGQVIHNYAARGIVLQSETTANMDVLNGIAVHPLNGNLLITGKNWSRIYEVRPVPTEI